MLKKILFTTLFILLCGLFALKTYMNLLEEAKNTKEYPVKLLEEIVKANIVSSTTYKRIKYTIYHDKDKMEVVVSLKFSSQNRMGAIIDTEATMKLCPDHAYKEQELKDEGKWYTQGDNITEARKESIARTKKTYKEKYTANPEIVYANWAISFLILDNKIISKENLSYLNLIASATISRQQLPNNIEKNQNITVVAYEKFKSWLNNLLLKENIRQDLIIPNIDWKI